MSQFVHDFVIASARHHADKEALVSKRDRLSYAALEARMRATASGMVRNGLRPHDRVALYLAKQTETVLGMFGTSLAGGVYVPVNPVLKAPQVGHILADSGARVLVTTRDRLTSLGDVLAACPELELIVLTDGGEITLLEGKRLLGWAELEDGAETATHRIIDVDVASILYTSGSTGKPKGVTLSHRNVVAGAVSVASYLENNPDDRVLAALPFSFDVGFSQLSTAFCSGASVVLHDYFLPRDIIAVMERESINALTGVPPFWMQIAELDWPDAVGERLRYFANTGGKMPRSLLDRLRRNFPNARPYLMYGLTEAFRSTYLPPEEVDSRPDSIGKAIPNAEILVLREDGTPCDPDEPGELVHRGALVSMGYWNDPERTAERFRPLPSRVADGVHQELAVWSGDLVRQDAEGFLYFIGRRDGMIKTSGYRVSPTEVEEMAFSSALVSEAAALGVEDEKLGQRIVLVVTPAAGGERPTDELMLFVKSKLPAYMVPSGIEWRESLPRNPNGKIDRKALEAELAADAAQDTGAA